MVERDVHRPQFLGQPVDLALAAAAVDPDLGFRRVDQVLVAL